MREQLLDGDPVTVGDSWNDRPEPGLVGEPALVDEAADGGGGDGLGQRRDVKLGVEGYRRPELRSATPLAVNRMGRPCRSTSTTPENRPDFANELT